MKASEWIFGALIGAAIVNVLVNGKNNTAGVINAGGTQVNSIFKTLVTPG